MLRDEKKQKLLTSSLMDHPGMKNGPDNMPQAKPPKKSLF
jgi:hypothetical protein